MYAEPFIDIDEWRDAPVRHRYVHGGFRDTELLFSFYFPPAEAYGGRFFQPLQAISGNENSAPMSMNQAFGVDFAIASGGYLVEFEPGQPRHVRRQRRGQRRRRPAFTRAGRRDVRRASALRLRLWRQRRRLQDAGLRREFRRRLGRQRAVRARHAGQHPPLLHRAGARDAHPRAEVPADCRRARARRQRRSLCRPDRRRGRRAARGHPLRLPAAGLVQRPPHRVRLHRRLHQPRRPHRRRRSHLLRRLLEQARLPGRRSARLAAGRADPARDPHRRPRHAGRGAPTRPAAHHGRRADQERRRLPRRAAARRAAGRQPARRLDHRPRRRRGRPPVLRRRRRARRGDDRLRPGPLPCHGGATARRRSGGRQLGLSGHPDLPSPPDPGPGIPGLGPVQGPGRRAALPAASAAAGTGGAIRRRAPRADASTAR